MKLKYYLRGVGIGIIFATLVMTVSAFVHKYNISDEYIINEARKLGMVMKDELKNDEGLWGSADTEDTQVSGSEVVSSESENTSQSESTSESGTTSEQNPVVPETPSESESESESETVEYVTIVIEAGDYARQVAEKVCAAGLVEDAEDFRKYIGNRGYGQSMHPGTYYIPVGSDYEEICLILIVRQN